VKNKHLVRIARNNKLVNRIKIFTGFIKQDFINLDYKLDLDLLEITYSIGCYSCNDYQFHKECKKYLKRNLTVRRFLYMLNYEYTKKFMEGLCVLGETYDGSKLYNIHPQIVKIINDHKHKMMAEIVNLYGVRYGEEVFNLLQHLEI